MPLPSIHTLPCTSRILQSPHRISHNASLYTGSNVDPPRLTGTHFDTDGIPSPTSIPDISNHILHINLPPETFPPYNYYTSLHYTPHTLSSHKDFLPSSLPY